MTRWHTDAPIRPVRPLAPLAPTPAAELFRSDQVAAASLRLAKAHWRRKLKARAREQAANKADLDGKDAQL